MKEFALIAVGVLVMLVASILFDFDFSGNTETVQNQKIQIDCLHENNKMLEDSISSWIKQDSIRKESILKLTKHEKEIRNNIFFYNAVKLDSIIAKYTGRK